MIDRISIGASLLIAGYSMASFVGNFSNGLFAPVILDGLGLSVRVNEISLLIMSLGLLLLVWRYKGMALPVFIPVIFAYDAFLAPTWSAEGIMQIMSVYLGWMVLRPRFDGGVLLFILVLVWMLAEVHKLDGHIFEVGLFGYAAFGIRKFSPLWDVVR